MKKSALDGTTVTSSYLWLKGYKYITYHRGLKSPPFMISLVCFHHEFELNQVVLMSGLYKTSLTNSRHLFSPFVTIFRVTASICMCKRAHWNGLSLSMNSRPIKSQYLTCFAFIYQIFLIEANRLILFCFISGKGYET